MGMFRRALTAPVFISLAILASTAEAADWTWADRLDVADAPTRQRLKLCGASVSGHFAAVRAAAFDFALSVEKAAPGPSGNSGIVTSSSTYQGKVRWLDGSVHYDYRPNEGERRDMLGVIRTQDMLTWVEDNPVYGLFLVADFPPPSMEQWYMNRRSRLPVLDPKLHYGGVLSADPDQLRDIAMTKCRKIESQDNDGLIRIVLFLRDLNRRVDIYCDRNNEYLPVKYQSGNMSGQEHRVDLEQDWQWKKTDGTWYPSHYTETQWLGEARVPVKFYDLHVSNLRLNESAGLTASDFKLESMEMPDGYGGIDRRTRPPRQLITVAGRLREHRPGDKVPLPAKVQQRMAEEEVRAEARAGQEAQVLLGRRIRNLIIFWSSIAVSVVSIALLTYAIWRRARGRRMAA